MLYYANQYKIVGINSEIDAEGRISTPSAPAKHSYPFTEIEKINGGVEGSIWLVESKTDGKNYVAKHQILPRMEYKYLFEWRSIMAQFPGEEAHPNIIRGHHSYWDEGKKLQIIIMDYCRFGDLLRLVTLHK